jgi:spore coat protein CotH
MMTCKRLAALLAAAGVFISASVWAQPDGPPDGMPPGGGFPFFGPGGPGGGFRGGTGGPMGGVKEKQQILKQFDLNNDHYLNADELKAARQFLVSSNRTQGRFGGPRGFGPRGNSEAGKPGPKVSLADAKSYPGASLYASNVLRTLFLQFEADDWEKQLSDFHGTDVDVPARLTVDGKAYPEVGVHFRGSSSYMMVGEGLKRSLNLSMDYVHDQQRLLGYRTVNLLNSHEDPSFLHSVIYYEIARQYLPTPKANLVKLVINGESWGVYVNVEQFNKDFLKEWYGDAKGARWKTPGSPRGNAGLAYLGEDAAAYKKLYEIKTKDDPKAWADLIKLCKTLCQTPPEKLEEALSPMFDIDQALWFLALENVFVNNDGYWTRACDYDLYQDSKGRFHVVPYDANETFGYLAAMGGPGGGPGMGGGRRGGMRGGQGAENVELDLLAGSSDTNKPMLNRLLQVPALKTRYLQHVRTLAEEWLDWNKLGPLVTRYHALIADEVKADTRKLSSTEAFDKSLTEDTDAPGGMRGTQRVLSYKHFAELRRAYVLKRLAEMK